MANTNAACKWFVCAEPQDEKLTQEEFNKIEIGSKVKIKYYKDKKERD